MTLEDAQLLIVLTEINTIDAELKEALKIASQCMDVVIEIPKRTGMSVKELINNNKLK